MTSNGVGHGDDRPAADLIVAGAPVYGSGATGTGVDAVAIRDDRILAVGKSADIRKFQRVDTALIELDRGCIVPGLIDGHAHMDREGLKRVFPSLDGAEEKGALLERIRQEAERKRPGEWVVTMPFGDSPSYEKTGAFDDCGYPNRHDLDRVAPENPVYIKAIWGYWRARPPLVSIANTRALELAGINRHTRAPSLEVEIVVDPVSGDPTGVFLENTMMPIVELTLLACAPNFTFHDRLKGLECSMAVYNGFGTTGVYEGHGVADEVLQAYRALAGQRRLTVRSSLVLSPKWGETDHGGVVEHLRDLMKWVSRQSHGDSMLAIGGIYAEIDEEKANWIRARSAPQTGWAGFHYDCGLPRHLMKEVLLEAARSNLRANCIFADVATLFEEVNGEVPIDHLRWSWGHLAVLSETDISRAKDLGLVMVTHTNRHIAKAGSRHRNAVGAGNEDQIVPLRRLLDAGVPVSFGSDNLPPSLFKPIFHAVARRDQGTGEVIAPGQKLSRSEALHCATWGGAYLMGREEEIGTLDVGKKADLAILDDDLMSVAEGCIADLHSVTTIVDGSVVLRQDNAERTESAR